MRHSNVKRVLFGLLALGVSLWGARAEAGEIHTAIYVLTDTSGSMLMTPSGTETYGDGSAEHPHVVPADVSRLYMAKEALTTVVFAYGEVRWGLARFSQNVGENYFCMCHDDPGTSTTAPCSVGTPGLNQEQDAGGGAVCMQCDMSSPYPDYDLPGTNDRACINYAGGIYAGCTDPHTAEVLDGADILVALAENNENRILMWIDHQETAFAAGIEAATGDHCFTGGVMQDCELRGVGGTPIGGSLQDLYTQLSTVDIGNDPLRGCRPYSIIVLTDGANSCPTVPATWANNLRATPDMLNSCVVPADCPQGATCDTATYSPGRCVYDVKTYVIGFALTPVEFQSANAIANAGGTGTAIPAADQDEIASAMAEIIAESIKPELCNGVDDDCDAEVDEGFPIGQACNNGMPGVCYATGTYVCDPGDPTAVICEILPAPPNPGDLVEVCNGLDDDCDGEVDEGSVCTCNGPELCNGFDDYCDAYTTAAEGSEDPNVGQVCGTDVGACVSGVTVCNAGTIQCNGTGPVAEACDANIAANDQNCNGVNNDGIAPQACTNTNGYGSCGGMRTCDVDGTWTCWAAAPAPESCNNNDDDCDGSVDEGLSQACVVANAEGTCSGTETCTAGAWVGCTAATPTAESCNNADDNCDGSIDEGLSQPCVVANGDGSCNGTETCSAGSWIGCTAATPTAEICNNADDDCDGSTDEFVTQACYSGPGGTEGVGPCIGGNQTCTTGTWGGCAGEVTPNTDLCDGIDNDCDGFTDEGLGQTTCGLGICQNTVQNCVAGVVQTCDPFLGVGTESCNGDDDDCDGVVDGLTESCFQFGTGCVNAAGVWTCTGVCNAGTRSCPVGTGTWGSCQGATGPSGEVCDNQDNDCDGAIDESLTEACYPAGYGPSTGCTGPGACQGACTEGSRTCTTGAWGACGGAVTPSSEACNNIDDDCDGATDENLSRACLVTNADGTCNGTETCNAGGWVGCTAATPAPETCNGTDDNCDGAVDEGLTQPCSITNTEGTCNGTETCSTGAWISCTASTPAAEICNNADDDCDGAIDENLTQSCYNGPGGTAGVGECVAGTRTCTTGAWGSCAGEQTPLAEVCDNLDNDCDNSTDEGLGQTTCGLGACENTVQNCVGGVTQTCDPLLGAVAETCDTIDNDCDGTADGLTEACYPFGTGCVFAAGVWTCQGVCNAGSRFCPVGSGAWGACQGASGPGAEVCDGQDNDCDGLVDENLTEACYPAGYGPSTGCTAPGACQGACQEGTRTCGGGAWGACGGSVTPIVEVCDGVDNDCDGQIDEGLTRACQIANGDGTCSGTETCAAGSWGACTAATPGPETCNNVDDDCDGAVDETLSQACSVTNGFGTCDGSETCNAGAWLGCTASTPAAEICNNADDDCDGSIDENLTQSCYNGPVGTDGIGLCLAGSRSCSSGAWGSCLGETTPAAELCDGDDNDCDGATDEGLGQTTCGLGICQNTVQNCVAGVPQTCDPLAGQQAETCDGQDNDCDGIADGLSQACYSHATGCTFGGGVWTCQGICSAGNQTCPAGGAGNWTSCQFDIGPATEVCDGQDNDCDGQTDENLTQACYPLGYGATTGCTGPGACLGVCQEGSRGCTGGAWGACGSAVTPSAEQCDNLDNDCDGQTDEGLSQACQVSNAFGTCTGVETCAAGTWASCTANTPAAEICNNIDDDCDGAVDDNVTQTCYSGPAGTDGVGACHGGTETCIAGTWGSCQGEVVPAVEVCDGIDNDCDGLVDEDANGVPLTEVCYSGPAGTDGVGVCVSGVRTCSGGAWSTCVGEVPPTAEQCNGADDDCDGQTDEDLGTTTCGLGNCQNTIDNCVAGVPQTCDPYQGAQPEVCDGVDNDCDGLVDGIARTCYEFGAGCTETAPGVWNCDGACAPGLQLCPAGGSGVWGECQYDVGPSPEVCDNIDNDCDAQTDENATGMPLAQDCYPPGSGPTTGCTWDASALGWDCLGLCTAGARECTSGVWGSCSGHVTPAVEVCDGSDNDCDGQIDEEEDIPGLDQPCGTALGRCTPGILRCINSQEICEGGDGPYEGVCNGQDDDCDGEIDEADEVSDEEGVSCGDATGLCEPGLTQCVGGALQCVGGVNPAEEVCDGEDNDCDGEVDNQAECPPSSWCVEGDCRLVCDPTSEFPCPGTLQCVERTHEEDLVNICMDEGTGDCGGVTCPDGWLCENDVCVDPCDPNPCAWYEECNLGACLDTSCTGLGQNCAAGEFCLDHVCVENPCLAADCDAETEHCIADCPSASDCTFTCQPLCLCGPGETCGPGGVCETDLCDGADCLAGEMCDPATGDCVPDDCFLVPCPGGEICNGGDCTPDPCLNTECPLGFHCDAIFTEDATSPVCTPDDGVWTPGEIGDKFLATGGGGCACDQASPTGGLGNVLWILGCLGLMWFQRRRRLLIATRRRLLGLGAVLLSLGLGLAGGAGCRLDPWQQGTDGSLITPDAGPDTGIPDAEPDACVATEEVCDEADNDCDGVVDNGYDLTTDPYNCGACDTICEYDFAFATCAQSQCAMGDCLPGHWDVNSDATDGCEYSCHETNDGTETCDNLDNDCDGEVDEDFDLATDPLNCGQCHRTCAFFNGVGSCTNGNCELGSCRGGHVDKDGNPNNGCECQMGLTEGTVACVDGGPSTCDASEVCADVSGDGSAFCATIPVDGCDGVDNDCDGQTDEDAASLLSGAACYTHPVGCTDDGSGVYTCAGLCETGIPTCFAGGVICGAQTGPAAELCDDLDNDCNGVVDDGFDKQNDPANCGGCGIQCAAIVTNGIPGCAGGACVVLACLPGYWDLNNDPSDGCEYACTYTNGGVEACGDGVDNDCNNQIDEGFDFTGDSANCGACGNDCGSNVPFGTATTGCTASTCTYQCLPNHYDLNGDVSQGQAGNGCEYACTVTGGGTETCDGVDNNCDGTTDEGFDKQTDVAHCGACNNACSANVGASSVATGCANGVCQFTCAAGFVDLNGDVGLGSAGDGCECQVTNGGVEICDNVDNDCDGSVDEAAGGTPLTQACYTGPGGTENVGPCVGGNQSCNAGVWSGCQGEVLPAAEVCDNIDNDCDSVTDENAGSTPLSQACYTGPAGTENVGPCVGGNQSCNAGTWGVCGGEVIPQIEQCDGADNDCDGSSDEDFNTQADMLNCGSCGWGCTAHAGSFSLATGCAAGACQYICQSGHYDLNGNIALGDTGDGCEYTCTLSNGGVEACGDGVDNDCDGQTDEGFDFSNDPVNCGACGYSCAGHTPFGATSTGCSASTCQYSCQANFYDLNNDLTLGDAGNGCEYSCTASGAEICDDLDNDCDGTVDEGFDKQTDMANCGSCSTTCAAQAGANSSATSCANGVCQFACNAGFVDLNGDVSLGTGGNGCEYGCVISNGGVEICDGNDNDCDNETDEAPGGGALTQACYSGAAATENVGPCHGGSQTCSGGGWGACTGEVTPQVETCDNIDNDCDGANDEAGGGGPLTQACYTGPASTENVGLCAGGNQSCTAGAWGACAGEVTPQIDICDTQDNDCDGTSDEDFNTQSDITNCGSCGWNCAVHGGAFSQATGCAAGSCQYICQSNHYDLNGNIALGDTGDGCEYACTLSNGGVEACGDGVDNDCDGQTDEGFDFTNDPANCGACGYSCAAHTPFGATSTGCSASTCQYSCQTNYYDLNSDLALGDAGNGCEYSCTASGAEICDNLDNDCDGTVDEGFDKQTDMANCGSCSTACAAQAGANSSATSCTNGVCQFACDANYVDLNGDVSLGSGGNGCEYSCTNTGVEICDGNDNDCDGVKDEDAGGAPLTQACYSGGAGTENVGPCHGGTQTCSGAAWGVCAGEVTPQVETCDNIDNDCDAAIDEAGGGGPLTQACYTGPGSTQGVGLCSGGNQSCTAGAWGACGGEVTPQIDICDTQDNDCDGASDEDFDTQSDITNCGSCGYSCVAHVGANSYTTSCVTGNCQFDCLANFYDSNGDVGLGDGGNGCEYGCTISNGGVEACGDGIDNDCDGATDEGFDLQNDSANCGACAYSCAAHTPAGATTTGCSSGSCQFACQPNRYDIDGDLALGDGGNGCEYACVQSGGEVCDNLDNDCDGVIDDGFDKQNNASHCGSCNYVCAAHSGANSTAMGCSSGVCQFTCNLNFYDLNGDVSLGDGGNGCEYSCTTSGAEVCDNVDNDCDGATDEDAGGAPLTQACYTGPGGTQGVGNCVGGTQTCSGGGWGSCAGEVVPGTELCDTQDNDCDSAVDEDFNLLTDLNNCGACGASCWTGVPANAYPDACNAGSCHYACLTGFSDLDGDLNTTGITGCEYTCPVNPPSTEYCDGLDNDCDGSVDEGLTPPVGFCSQGQPGSPCDGVGSICEDPDGAGGFPHGWYCQYPAAVETDPVNPNQLLGYETLCDGLDGDCDGIPDDNFGLGNVCDNGAQGSCRVAGTIICDAGDPSTTLCDLPAPGTWPTPTDEVCDAADNDCDGLTDENESVNNPANDPGGVQGWVVDNLVTVNVGGVTTYVYEYEASRPSADVGQAGTGSDARACSRYNVIPWANVTYEQATNACARAGMRLCGNLEWHQGCNGGGNGYPYMTPYDSNACNGHDQDPAVDGVEPTGTQAGCDAPSNAADMSGNLREWTVDVMGYTSGGESIYTLRGGSFADYSGGLTCEFDSSGFVEDVFAPNVGFRCCTTCGNGTIDPGETCDPAPPASSANCNPVHCGPDTCGDGTTDAGEQCDDGNLLPMDGCSPQCRFEAENCSSNYPGDEDNDGLANCADPDCVGTWCDDMQDNDGDGFTEANGDCCDSGTEPACNGVPPASMHPAVVENCNNGIDDNCNGLVDAAETTDLDGDGSPVCHANPALADCDDNDPERTPLFAEVPADGIDNDCDGIVDEGASCDCASANNEAEAMNLCDALSVTVTHYGAAAARGFRNTNWGAVGPQLGCSMAGLSSGPVWSTNPQTGTDNGAPNRNPTLAPFNCFACTIPGGTAWEHMGPSGCCENESVRDVGAFSFTVEVPHNVEGFSFDFLFLSAEYPEWVHTIYNDTFYAILSTTALAQVQNISFDINGQPLTINNGWFETPPAWSQDITGTGYDTTGSASGWLTTTTPVTPGEVFTLTFWIHDEGDAIYDSALVLDNWQWEFQPVSGPSTTK